jgi:hypothetical protein
MESAMPGLAWDIENAGADDEIAARVLVTLIILGWATAFRQQNLRRTISAASMAMI